MRSQNGFTLIEMLVVVAIIGIVASIAMPQYFSYRNRAYNALAMGDLKNGVIAEESYFVDHLTYLECDSAIGASGCPTVLPGFKPSSDSYGTATASAPTSALNFSALAAAPLTTGFRAKIKHKNGSLFCGFNSASAELTQTTAAPY